MNHMGSGQMPTNAHNTGRLRFVVVGGILGETQITQWQEHTAIHTVWGSKGGEHGIVMGHSAPPNQL